MATKQQIVKIHAVKSQLGISDEEYREILGSYDCASSKDLSIAEAAHLIGTLTSIRPAKAGLLSDRAFPQAGLLSDRAFPQAGLLSDRTFPQAGLLSDRTFPQAGLSDRVELGRRDRNYATGKQLRMIEGLWQSVSRNKDASSLNSFIKRITGLDHITFLERSDASKVIVALRKMNSTAPISSAPQNGGTGI